ncbi:MAG TPA: GNAT family N-acetyltransferase [Candidatus Limnocylindrales bacterium]|nr:GNAT family N-acetyltransferase [Candidatus Limnocylindrales bacterium]
MTGVAATLRTATEGDLRAIDAVLRVNDEPPPGEPMYPTGAQDPYLGHLIRRGTSAVAEIDGVVVGFGATVDTGRSTHLADLFVLPTYHGRGLGGRLLTAVFGDRFPRTTFSSDDPRALPLYVRAGMTPVWPSLYISGDPGGLPDDPEDIAVEDATFDDVARLEGEWGGSTARRTSRSGLRTGILAPSWSYGPASRSPRAWGGVGSTGSAGGSIGQSWLRTRSRSLHWLRSSAAPPAAAISSAHRSRGHPRCCRSSWPRDSGSAIATPS